MHVLGIILIAIQLLVTVVVGLYFFRQLKQQRRAEPAARSESSREMDKLQTMRAIHLSRPLA